MERNRFYKPLKRLKIFGPRNRRRPSTNEAKKDQKVAQFPDP
jgi:hypothetical protein